MSTTYSKRLKFALLAIFVMAAASFSLVRCGDSSADAVFMPGYSLASGLVFSSSSYSFTTIDAGATTSETLTVTNNGKFTAIGPQFSVAAPYSVTSTTCGAELIRRESCTLTVQLAPTSLTGILTNTPTANYTDANSNSFNSTTSVTGTANPTCMWVKGSSSGGESGTYGTQGSAAAGNTPGGRIAPGTAVDTSGNLWLFGGWGHDENGDQGYLNDLWKFNGTSWTWVSGSKVRNQNGTYGVLGTAAGGNVPGGRQNSAMWSDTSGNLWLFGGLGKDSVAGGSGYLNDFWKWNGSQWTWIAGSDQLNSSGTFGTKGVANAANIPSARQSHVVATDASGTTFWLHGGTGRDSAGADGRLNDLWRFDGSNWIWVSGDSTKEGAASYGTKGTASSSNVPGARYDHVGWVDASGNLWIGFGVGQDDANTNNLLNDLWKWNGSQWTWVGGSKLIRATGVYGTRFVADSANVPGARQSPIALKDSSGNTWLIGGSGINSIGFGAHYMNDFWKWDGSYWTWMNGSNIGSANGVYGTQNTASASNIPGGRQPLAGWIDSSGYIWIFGGQGRGASGSTAPYQNDLWKCTR